VDHQPLLPARLLRGALWGGGAVLLQKPRLYLEAYSDLGGEVVNFFQVLRERSGTLVRAINLTPYAKAAVQPCFEGAPCRTEPECDCLAVVLGHASPRTALGHP
jgi:hypothetical protein